MTTIPSADFHVHVAVRHYKSNRSGSFWWRKPRSYALINRSVSVNSTITIPSTVSLTIVEFTFSFFCFLPGGGLGFLLSRQALDELLQDDERFGFIVMDGNGTLYGTLQGRSVIQSYLFLFIFLYFIYNLFIIYLFVCLFIYLYLLMYGIFFGLLVRSFG